MTGLNNQSQDWIVVHGDGEDATAVAVDICYHDRDPYGEYVLYAAGDAGSITDGRISIRNYRYLSEVRVTFEEDLVSDGLSDIQWCEQDFAEQGEAFIREIWPSWQAVSLSQVADAIFPPGEDFVMARSVLFVTKDQAAWLEVTRVEADLPAEMALTFCRVEQDRLLEIKSVLKDADVPVRLITDHWQGLVDRFKELPYGKLSGAQRFEPADDEELVKFDLDTIGEVSGEA